MYELFINNHNIINAVDSICRDSTDTQCMIIQKISKSLKRKLINLYNSVLFISKCFDDEQHTQCAKKHRKVPNQKVTTRPKCFPFSFSSN